jgi:hypothetical protein
MREEHGGGGAAAVAPTQVKARPPWWCWPLLLSSVSVQLLCVFVSDVLGACTPRQCSPASPDTHTPRQVFAVSSAGVAFTYIGDVPALTLASWRLQLTALITLAAGAVQWRHNMPGDARMRLYADWWLSALSGVALALHFATWVWSLQHTSLAHSLLLVSTSPVLNVGWVRLGAIAAQCSACCVQVCMRPCGGPLTHHHHTPPSPHCMARPSLAASRSCSDTPSARARLQAQCWRWQAVRCWRRAPCAAARRR